MREQPGTSRQSITDRSADRIWVDPQASGHRPAQSTRPRRPGHVQIERIDRAAGRHEQPVSSPAAKAQIGAGFGQMYLSDEIAIRRVATDAVLSRVAHSHAAPDIPVRIRPQPVRAAAAPKSDEHSAIAELPPFTSKTRICAGPMGDRSGIHDIQACSSGEKAGRQGRRSRRRPPSPCRFASSR